MTLKEAVRGILALLGYADEDFSGDISGARMSMFYALELNEELDRQPAEILTRTDCVNLFYNLLKTEMKSGGKAYATVLGCELNSDGEVKPLGLADTSLNGPRLIPKGRQLGDYVPFNVQQANIFVNGDASGYEALKSYISSNYVVIYYNTQAKTVWAYIADEDVQTGRCGCCLRFLSGLTLSISRWRPSVWGSRSMSGGRRTPRANGLRSPALMNTR